jgi:hypothetical protein
MGREIESLRLYSGSFLMKKENNNTSETEEPGSNPVKVEGF